MGSASVAVHLELRARLCHSRPAATPRGSIRAEHGVRRCIAQILDFGVLYLSGLHLLHTLMPLNDVLQFGFFVSAGLILYFARNRPLRLAIGLLIVFMPAHLISSALVLHQERSYFGVHRAMIGESGQIPATDARHHRARG